LYFQAPFRAWRNLFSASWIFCGGRYQPSHTRISDLQKVPARLSLFLKGEKIPALLYGGKGPEYMPFSDFRPIPSAYWPRAQISNHGKASTQVLFLYITIFSSHLHTSLFKSLFSTMCKYLSNN
jgi:hypothetical protein